MRTLTLTAVLATALAGTGCFVSTSEPMAFGDLHVYWRFLRTAPSQPGGTLLYDAGYNAVASSGICPESYVDTVRVDWGAGYFDIDCTGPSGAGYVQGAVVASLPAGRNTITLTGYRGSRAVYTSTDPDVMVPANGVATVYEDVRGIARPLEAYAYLAYGVPGTDYLTCAEALSPNFTVDVYDLLGNKIDDYAAGCAGPLPAFVYTGSLDLDDYLIRMRGFDRTTSALVFDSCDQSLSHFAGQTGSGGFTATLYTAPVPTCQ